MRILRNTLLFVSVLTVGCNRATPPAAYGHSQSVPVPKTRSTESGERAVDASVSFVGPLVDELARAEQGGKWGFVDADGRWVVPAQYEWAESFSEGLAAVKQDEHWGYIDKSASVVVAFQYRDAARFSEQTAAVKNENGWMYIDKGGRVSIDGPFETARPFHEAKAWVKSERLFLYGNKVLGNYPNKNSLYLHFRQMSG